MIPDSYVVKSTERRVYIEISTEKKMSREESPSFFKIILENVNKDKMRFPPKFLPHILNDLRKTATLKLINGGVWTVEVNATVEGVFLEEGWQQFVKANSLMHGHFLVFTYEGEMNFSVQIFEVNGIERIQSRIRPAPAPTTPSAAGATAIPVVGKKRRGRPRKNPILTEPFQTPGLPIIVAPNQVNALKPNKSKSLDKVKKLGPRKQKKQDSLVVQEIQQEPLIVKEKQQEILTVKQETYTSIDGEGEYPPPAPLPETSGLGNVPPA